MNSRRSIQHVALASILAGVASLGGCTGGSDGGSASGSGGGGSGAGGAGGGGGGGSGAAAGRSDGAKMSADDKAAADFVQGKIDERWVKAADGWTTQWHKRNVFGEEMEGVPEILYTQYRNLKFTVDPEPVSESQKLNGATYRAAVGFEYGPMRDYRSVENHMGPAGWSPWREDTPALSFAVELRNGKWLTEDLEMFAGFKPDSTAVPSNN